ncbi:MAG TPA: transcriptional repressor NrdR [Henriciella marina]|uniref:transcriptional regulator NrdR n=1 Tax=Henriciella sp. TaxID=1968823 RepID=UPI0017BB17C2|nr:transcriptional regulator NrdR [Henriciella sp.]HIG22057.1 transcriptional repressor NrdR [Henriciella sp.]HIK64392.1 transcriptional repressor NrdR [Henriciella marina]
MKCPFCTAENTAVKDSRPAEDNTAVRRRRACEVCGGRFTTFERVQLREIIVVKRDGKRALFDREKVAKSVTIALRKRAVGDESVEQLVSGIVRKLESSGETEVTSEDIGELVMDALKTVDPVGYVRYASVYKDFRDPTDFAKFIDSSALDEHGSDE